MGETEKIRVYRLNNGLVCATEEILLEEIKKLQAGESRRISVVLMSKKEFDLLPTGEDQP